MDIFYKKVKLSSLELESKFLYEGTLFELVANSHAILVGLTVDEFKSNGKADLARQPLCFKDDDMVLIRLKGEPTV